METDLFVFTISVRKHRICSTAFYNPHYTCLPKLGFLEQHQGYRSKGFLWNPLMTHVSPLQTPLSSQYHTSSVFAGNHALHLQMKREQLSRNFTNCSNAEHRGGRKWKGLHPTASCVGERILWVLLNKLNLENSSTNWLQTGETSETALKASQEACEVYTYAHGPHPRISGLGYIDPTIRVDDNGSGVEMHTRYRQTRRNRSAQNNLIYCASVAGNFLPWFLFLMLFTTIEY